MVIYLRRKIVNASLVVVSAAVIILLSTATWANLLMGLLSPVGGIYGSADIGVKKEYMLKGLIDSVQIIIDSRGVPHIYAKNEHDLFYAVGFMHAKDRLWQMDIQRRLAQGRVSEILGEGALKMDIFMRVIGLARAARITAEYIKRNYPEHAKLYEAYANGVNAYIEMAIREGKLPLMFRLLGYTPDPWSVEDSIAFAKLMAWTLTNFFEPLKLSLVAAKIGGKETLKLFPIYHPLQLNVTGVPGDGTVRGESIKVDLSYLLGLDWYSKWATGLNFSDPVFAAALEEAVHDILSLVGENPRLGSNNWAVAPFKSERGAAMLADDPHLSLQIPSLWYEVDLHCPTINVYGVTLAGIPTVIIGFNRKIAWGLTNAMLGVMDFYVELIHPRDPTLYFFNGSWRKIEVIEEVIKVKGREPHILKVNLTVHGPILTRKGLTISARWTGMETTLEAIAIIDVMRAQNFKEFYNALRSWHVPSQNFMYADVYGNIALVVPGRFPLKLITLPNGEKIYVLGSRSVLNGTGDYEWVHYIPHELVPHCINPEQGYLAAPNQMNVGPKYPFFILGGWWAPAARAQRINMLLKKPLLSLEDMMRAQVDIFDWFASSLTPLILRAAELYPPRDPDMLKAINLLGRWDYNMRKDLEAPSVWWYWLIAFYNRTFIQRFRQIGLEKVRILPYPETIIYLALKEPGSTWFNGDFYRTAVLALEDAVKVLKDKFGDDWRWGRAHAVYFRHLSQLKALSFGPYPQDGDSFTLMAAPMPLEGGYVTHGPSWRMVVIMSEPPEAYGIYPGGQSENPVSPHYGDFIENWLNYRYYRLNMAVSPEEITDVEARTVLLPGGG